MTSQSDLDRRVLIFAPVGRDAVLAQAVLQRAGLSTQICTDLEQLACELASGAGSILLTQEALSPAAAERLQAMLAAQPAWSDLPLVVLVSGEGIAVAGKWLGGLTTATMLERPVRAAMLVSTMYAAQRARRRQYELRDQLQARAEAEEAERRARAEAEAAVRIRDEFLAAVAHDLKNPLGAIKGYAQLLQRRVTRTGIPDAQPLAQGLATIDNMVARTVAQINELLDLARLQAGRALQLDLRPTDLVALAERVAEEYRQISSQHLIRVEATQPELVGVWDTFRLERVLGNLLSNAIKYSLTGGEILLTISEEAREQEVWAAVTVRDQGMGIPPADLPHIFERFYRASNAASRVPGTGLGLAGARHIVEEHGGTISVASVEGGGAAFTIRLPIAQTARTVPAAQDRECGGL
jgi:signal transduction histidine kinase